MKNLIIFQDIIRGTYGHDWTEEELFNFWKAQVDNSIRMGWKEEDLVILTNLPFQYKNTKVIKSNYICKHNKYFNRILGMWEIFKFHYNEPIWMHDLDDWQISKFDFPTFKGSVGCCLFCNFTQICISTMFIKPESLPIWELMTNFIQNNPYENEMRQIGDDNLLNKFVANDEDIRKEISILDNSYNIGMTELEMRLNKAKEKIKIVAFKPFIKKDYEKIKQYNLIDDELENIFKNNNLLSQPNEVKKYHINYFDLGLWKFPHELDHMVNNVFPKFDNITYSAYGIEADLEFANIAKEFFKDNPNVKIFNFAISNKKGMEKLYVNECNEKPELYGLGNSIFKTKCNVNTNIFNEVPAGTFSNFIKENNINLENSINILKVNIEGAELYLWEDIKISDIRKYFQILCGHPTHDIDKVSELSEKKEYYYNLLEEMNIKLVRLCGVDRPRLNDDMVIEIKKFMN